MYECVYTCLSVNMFKGIYLLAFAYVTGILSQAKQTDTYLSCLVAKQSICCTIKNKNTTRYH